MSSARFPSRPLSKSYEPASFEAQIYQYWEDAGFFDASDTPAQGQKSFAIVIPPPNVTGVLHMGHALTNTIQDILIRWRRMSGDNALWLPGTDHAGIATQAQVEKQIAKEGKGPSGKPLTRHDLGREAFVARTWKWKNDHASMIKNQLKRLGSSLDWKRERFTMDDGLSAAVREVFVKLYEEGLIYRGERIINWCPRCQTALSDLEVIPTERKGHFWHLVYKIVDDAGTPVKGPDGVPTELVIATTRPETLLGDTAVAVHPEDERYLHLHGKKAVLPLLGRLIPVITDAYVEKDFGSGALKVTPAHDFNDYEIGKRHDLPMVSVMGKDGRITPAGGPYAGLKFSEARERVIQNLKEQGLLVKTEDHVHKVGLCQRCDQVAEPIVSKQWFVKIEPLAAPAREAVRSGAITFTPKSWEKTYFEWMDNIRDWCISRQLWWGHQIPAWTCGRCQHQQVLRKDPTECEKCKAPASELKQDEDVLDTWFSSGLWPFSTLGWPEKTQALKTFYPTAILETGFDIIFFWVARMIMMGLHFMGEVPFRKVYLHAMVRDEKGEKMSKSKGNVIDPLVLVDQHGADPLRFTLAAMAGQGRDIKLSTDRVEGYRAFANKLWNATKFLHLQLDPAAGEPLTGPGSTIEAWIDAHHSKLESQNRWILSRLQALIPVVHQGLSDFELNLAAQGLYEFAWKEYCDWFIEFSKAPLREGGARRQESVYVLHYVLETTLRLLHPFMPFVTEELWQSLPWREQGSIMLQPFPAQPRLKWVDEAIERAFRPAQQKIELIRNFRGENGLSPKVQLSITTFADATALPSLEAAQGSTTALANLASDRFVKGLPSGQELAGNYGFLKGDGFTLRVSLDGIVDSDAELKRLQKEIAKIDEDISHVSRKLSQESFLAKAPPELVEKERKKLSEFEAKKQEAQAALLRLKK